MGVTVTLELDGQPIMVADPSGGDCAAAGDFDRLLPFGKTFPMLSRIDPFGEVRFERAEMLAVANETLRATEQALDDRERRGLLRLRALASCGSEIADAVLRALGD